MIVEQISKIKNYRIFHNFTWGKELHNLTQYNLIYGRNGSMAHNLSEGEKSAIALLYFLKTLNDRSFALKDGIVVIDDPITGLDNAGVARAFECIKERIQFPGQLFLLTHNDSFFGQVKEWLDTLNTSSSKPRVHYYMLGDQMDAVPRSSALIMHDALSSVNR